MNRWKRLSPSVKIGLVSFFVASLIVLPQITSDASGYADSDGFLLSAQNLSVAHPPGYGFISLAAFLFNRLVFWSSTAFAGNLQGFVAGTVITVTQIKAVSFIEAVIATISFDANGPTFVWSSPDVAVLVDDVLRFELTAYVEGCTNIEITLIGRFPRYILG